MIKINWLLKLAITFFDSGTKLSFGVEMPKIENGVLNISNGLLKKGAYKNKWKVPFYWNKLLDPQDIIIKGPPPKIGILILQLYGLHKK